MGSYVTSSKPVPAFDFGNWHNAEGCEISTVSHSGTVYVVCDTCHVAGEIEAISQRIVVASSATARGELDVNNSN